MASLETRYAEMNARFDERAKELRDLGFKYEHVESHDIAVFVCRIQGMKKPRSIQASAVMYADDFFWGQILLDATNYAKTWR